MMHARCTSLVVLLALGACSDSKHSTDKSAKSSASVKAKHVNYSFAMFSICQLVKVSEAVVEARVISWGPLTQLRDSSGQTYSDVTMAKLEIVSVLRGGGVGSVVDARVHSRVLADGSSATGPLAASQVDSGYFFLTRDSGGVFNISPSGGYFWREGGSLVNIQSQKLGSSVNDLVAQVAAATPSDTCPEDTVANVKYSGDWVAQVGLGGAHHPDGGGFADAGGASDAGF